MSRLRSVTEEFKQAVKELAGCCKDGYLFHFKNGKSSYSVGHTAVEAFMSIAYKPSDHYMLLDLDELVSIEMLDTVPEVLSL